MSYRANLDQPVFSALRRAVSASGFESYIVGGFVRDHFLGRESKDIDIVSLGNGLHLAKEFANLVQAKDVVTFENFGTALVKWSGFEVEFVGARKESYGRDSRKPLVTEGTFEEDQLRRDFTINALYFSLNEIGSKIWELISKEKIISEVLSELLNEYEVDHETLKNDLISLLLKMESKKLINFEN